MKEPHLVSVVVPVFNAESYLRSSIVSICKQTYQNLEIICVDDSSKDTSLSILNDLAKNDRRIKVLSNKVNLGISETLNYGFKFANGSIFVRMDADDEALPNRIESQLNCLIKNNYGLVGSPVIYITEHGDVIGSSRYFNDFQVITGLKWKSTIGHPTWMIRRDVFIKLQGYRNLSPAEDYDFLLRCVKENIKLGMTKQPLLKFRTQSSLGGTAIEQGLVQRRMFNYVKFINSTDKTIDWQIVDSIKKYNGIFKVLYKRSQIFYTVAMKHKYAKNYLRLTIWLVAALFISPHQLQFFLRALMSHFKFTKFWK